MPIFRLYKNNEDKQAAIAARLGICRNCLQRREDKKSQQRGTRIAIRIDGPLNASLIKACAQMGVTKRDYLKDALIRRLIAGGFV